MVRGAGLTSTSNEDFQKCFSSGRNARGIVSVQEGSTSALSILGFIHIDFATDCAGVPGTV
jgi:hypothetical protein